jgi:putative oxidoreductase
VRDPAALRLHQTVLDAPNGTWPIQNHGEPAVLFCFIFLCITAQGAGDWSLDELIRRKSGGATGVTR